SLNRPTQPGPHDVESVQTPLVPAGRIEFDTEMEKLELTEERGTMTLTAYSRSGLYRRYQWSAGLPPVRIARGRLECAQIPSSGAGGLGPAVGAFDWPSGEFRVWAGQTAHAGTAIAEYVERPWFAGGAVTGDTFVHLDARLRSAIIYHRGSSVE